MVDLYNSFGLWPLLILIAGGILLYYHFFKENLATVAKELSLNYVPVRNMAYPEHIRNLEISNLYTLNQLIEGERNNTSLGIYTFSKLIYEKQYFYFLITAKNKSWSFPYSSLERNNIAKFLVYKGLEKITSAEHVRVEDVPANYSFYCDKKDNNSEFINKIRFFLHNKPFKFKRITTKNDVVAFVFKIEEKRRVKKSILHVEKFLEQF